MYFAKFSLNVFALYLQFFLFLLYVGSISLQVGGLLHICGWKIACAQNAQMYGLTYLYKSQSLSINFNIYIYVCMYIDQYILRRYLILTTHTDRKRYVCVCIFSASKFTSKYYKHITYLTHRHTHTHTHTHTHIYIYIYNIRRL